MPRLTVNQRTKIIEWWHETKCVAQIQRNFHVVHVPGLNPTRLFSLWVPKRPNLFQSPIPDEGHLINSRTIFAGKFAISLKSHGKYGCLYAECDWTEEHMLGKPCLKFKGLMKAMEDKVGEKIPVTQTYRPNLQIDVVLVC